MDQRFQSDCIGRTTTPLLRVALLLWLALGCAAIDHGYKAQQYAGVPLQPTQGRGAERFPAELAMDETLARYVAEHGRPDYFYIVDRQKLYFFYVQSDSAAMFERVSSDPSESGYPSFVARKDSASAAGPSSSRIVIGSTPDSERS